MVLVFVEHADGAVDELSQQALTFARGLAGGDGVAALLIGAGAEDAAPALAEHGVATAHVAALDGGFAPQAYGRAVAQLAEPALRRRDRRRRHRRRQRGARPRRGDDRTARWRRTASRPRRATRSR